MSYVLRCLELESVGWDTDKLKGSHTASGNGTVQPLQKRVWLQPKTVCRVKDTVACDPGFNSWIYIPNTNGNIHPIKICTRTFRAALHLIAKRWKSLNCPSSDECGRQIQPIIQSKRSDAPTLM